MKMLWNNFQANICPLNSFRLNYNFTLPYSLIIQGKHFEDFIAISFKYRFILIQLKYNFIKFIQMTQKMEYLKNHPQIANTLADGFAHIYHEKPKFPITFLANFLKNHSQLISQQQQLMKRLHHNDVLKARISKQEENTEKQSEERRHAQNHQKQREEGFLFRIRQANYPEEMLSQFCQWIEKEKQLTGVYIGELQNATKIIDLHKEDSEEAHIDAEAPKNIKFKAASHSHNRLMIGKVLTQQSVIGKLLNQKPEDPAEENAEGQEGKEKDKTTKIKGEIYIKSVQQNKDLTFFKYPRLGAFYALSLKVKTYLHEKIFDANIAKTEAYKKAIAEFEKEKQERESKFKALYDQKAGAGAEEKQLDELEVNFKKEEAQIVKPKLEEYETVVRTFVVCFDTLGLDQEIDEEERRYFRQKVEYLRCSWESKQISILQRDIEAQLKIILQNMENPQAEQLTKLIEQEEKDLPSNQEVEKHKSNEKLAELEMNTLRIEKIKEYIADQKYKPFLENLLNRDILKFQEIFKLLCFFIGLSKEEVNHPHTNVFHWAKAKKLLTPQIIIQKMSQYRPRGNKPEVTKPYAKWQRILKNLDKLDASSVASFNIYLAFILRFLTIVGKTRISDREARRTAFKLEVQQRDLRIKEVEEKKQERDQKYEAAKAQAEAKQQAFDQEAWQKAFDEENPQIEIGELVGVESDGDLEEIVEQQ